VSRFCQLCGRAVVGKAYSYQHPVWNQAGRLLVCEACKQNANRCLVCRIPIGQDSQDGLCFACKTRALHCVVCTKPILQQAIYIEGKGPYCNVCVRTNARCDVCGVLVDKNGQLLTDGRHICRQCHATAVYQQQHAHLVYEQVKEIIHNYLQLRLNVPTGLVLVGRDQMSDILQQNGRVIANVTNTLGVYLRRGRRRGIYVQSGLPRLLLMQVIAHEWGHAWQRENGPLMRETFHKEGFAEWVAYKVMEHIDAKSAMSRMLARDDIYGQALRNTLNIEKQSGEAGVLDWCQTAR
jgi:hypothetical protein